MFDIFSTREIATGIWIIIIVIFIFLKESTRKPAIDVLKAITTKKLLIPFLIMVLYAVVITYIFSLTAYWNAIYLKDIALWTLFVGIPVCFGAVSQSKDQKYFRKIILDNLKFMVFVQFIIGSFTLHIAVELVLLPFIALLAMVEGFTASKDKEKQVNINSL